MLTTYDFPGANFVFSIFDSDSTNSIDAYDLGDVLRSLNQNPTQATIEKLGGTKKRGISPYAFPLMCKM